MRHEKTIKIKPLDPLLPWTWPKSKDLSRVTHRVAADELEQELMQDSKPGNKIALSWFRSCRLHGAMDWLRTIPRFHTFRVSQALWRVMFATTMCAPVVSSMMNLVCPCGNDSQLLRYGIHWYAQCNAVTLKTTRHNVVADQPRACPGHPGVHCRDVPAKILHLGKSNPAFLGYWENLARHYSSLLEPAGSRLALYLWFTSHVSRYNHMRL